MTINERKSLPLWKKILAIFISIIVFGFQIALIILFINILLDFSQELYQSVVGIIYIVFQLIGIGYVLYILKKPISVNYKLTWTFLILILPAPFCLLYTFNSNSRSFSRRKQKKFNDAFKSININYDLDIPKDYEYNNLINVFKFNTNLPVYDNTKYTYFNDAKLKHEDMLEELKNAKKYILLEYFIIAKGKLFDSIAPILEQKAQEGIKIYILFDDVGSRGFLAKRLLKKFTKMENVFVNNYQPLGTNHKLMFNYRDHRKICVIDGLVAYCGGDNLADEYIHEVNRFGYWRDNCGKYIGPAVMSFVYLFSEMWYLSTKELIIEKLEKPQYEKNDNSGYVMVFGDGPSTIKTPAYDLFLEMINSAKKYLYISTPYFIIDEAMLKAIEAKAKSGVEVILLMPGNPDKKPVFYMGRSNYSRILYSGVKIYEMNDSFNHAKNIIVDDRYAFEGTINMDYRSLFLHYECGAIIMDNPEIYKMKSDYLDAISKSKQIIKEDWEKRPLIQKIVAFILNIIAPFF